MSVTMMLQTMMMVAVVREAPALNIRKATQMHQPAYKADQFFGKLGQDPVNNYGPTSHLSALLTVAETNVTAITTLGTHRADVQKVNKSQTGLTVLHTRHVDLTLVSNMGDPWADAMPCYQSNVNECSCGDWGRWNPNGFAPRACVKNTLASIYALAKFVGGKGYTLHLKGGSLLGAMRCGTFIPWDYDVDFGIFVDSEQKAVALRHQINAWAGGSSMPPTIFVTIFGGPGFTNWHASSPAATTNGNVHLDGSVDSSVAHQGALIPCVFNDIVMHCPANYNEQLTESYGADWKTTPKRWADWSSHRLGSSVELDEATVDGCERRMSSIDAALAGMSESNR